MGYEEFDCITPHVKHLDFFIGQRSPMWEHKPDLTPLPLTQPFNFGETSVNEHKDVVRIVETGVNFLKGHGSSPATEGSFRNFNLHLPVQNMNLEVQLSGLIQCFGRLKVDFHDEHYPNALY
jgi:hypothetical protein